MTRSENSPWTTPRIAALARFAIGISVLNLLGHFWLGFEQAWAHPIASLITAYAVEVLMETVEAWSERRSPRFAGGAGAVVRFLLPAHITALAVAMLLYSNEAIAPVCFASAAAIASKYLIRIRIGGVRRHYLNPSNLGISVTLLLFPWVGIAMPYMFTENLSSTGDWLLPVVLAMVGSFLNARFTRRIPLIAAWLSGFALQAVIRSLLSDTLLLSALSPLTGVSFLLFTFYMVSDPATTPLQVRGQVLFGSAVALTYGLLMALHIVFGLFFALSLVCAGRGLYLVTVAALDRRRRYAIDLKQSA